MLTSKACDYHQVGLKALREVLATLCPRYVEKALLTLIRVIDTTCDHGPILIMGSDTYDCAFEKVALMLNPGTDAHDWVEEQADWARRRKILIDPQS